MGGLLVFLILFAWLAAVIWLARRITSATKLKPPMRPVLTVALAIVIFMLPVLDELAARPSFASLCRRGTILKLNAQSIKGKTVRLTVFPKNAPVTGTVIPVFRSHYIYRDTASGETLLEYDTYAAEGGILSRTIPAPGLHPLTGTFFCAPRDEESMQARYGFSVIN